MKKHLLVLSILLATLATVKAQTTAPDFTATDCNGVSHNLYTELNSGKVIVLNWVMPCASCVGPSLTAYNIVQSYASPNVKHYLIDDAGNTSCTTLSGWATNSGIGTNRTTFSTTAIVENSYGGIGMPHVVVVGPNHTIYFNGLNTAAGNATAIQNAINAAMAATGIAEAADAKFNMTVSPVWDYKAVQVAFSLKETGKVTLQMINEIGQDIQHAELGNLPAGNHTHQFDLRGQAAGVYFIRLISGADTKTVRFSVSD